MSQSIEHQLLNEDHQLIEVNHLGIPLKIYKLKIAYTHIMRFLGLMLLLIGCVSPAIMFMIIFLGLYRKQPDGGFYAAMLLGLSVFSFLVGLFILCFEVPRVRNQHLIVCEQGLIEVRKRGWSKKIKVLHWKDILTIRKFIDEYSILYQEREVFDLDNMYQDTASLVELIRQKSGVV